MGEVVRTSKENTTSIGHPISSADAQELLFCFQIEKIDQECNNGSPMQIIYNTDANLLVKLRTCDSLELETGGSIWHSSIRLAQYMIKNPSMFYNKRVLEIGAGCGLIGIVAAKLGASTVTITDIEAQVELIQQNIDLNFNEDEDVIMKPTTKCLYFGEEDDVTQHYDIIIGTDIGYDLSLHQPISTTISSILNRSSIHNSNCYCIIVEEIRWLDIYQWYLESISSHLKIVESRSLDYSTTVKISTVNSIDMNEIWYSVPNSSCDVWYHKVQCQCCDFVNIFA
eukprot:gene7637-10396_t